MKLNGKVVRDADTTRLLTMQDRLEHRIHRHEPPVLDQAPTQLENMIKGPDAAIGVIAVNKPPSLPVHPCGGYNFNSLLHILISPPISLPLTIQRKQPSIPNNLSPTVLFSCPQTGQTYQRRRHLFR